MKLVTILQQYNELNNGNLPRYLDSISRYTDALVVYDDASIDGSLQYVKEWKKSFGGKQLKEVIVISGEKNDYAAEVSHKEKMLNIALEIGADWIFRIDADEVLEKKGEDEIRQLCSTSKVDSYAFKNANLWRHPNYYRLDNSFNDFTSCRLWKNNGKLKYNNVKRGLHQRAVPDGLDTEDWAPFITLHYGFACAENIIAKFKMYKEHGQQGWELYRLIDERTLRLAKSNKEWFRNPPEDLPMHKVINRPLVSMVS